MGIAIVLLLALMAMHIDNLYSKRRWKATSLVLKELNEIEAELHKVETLTECAFWKNELLLLRKKHFNNRHVQPHFKYLFDFLHLQQHLVQNKRNPLYATN
jgi:hypothetical protein